MYKAYKFRLYPNDNQKILINKTFGCTRFIYNHFLNKCKEEKFIKAYDMCKELKELVLDYPFLKEVDSMALRCSIFNLEDSYKNYFSKRSAYPSFKNKFSKQSYRTNCITSVYKNAGYPLQVPYLAKGGIVDSPTLAMIGEGPNNEAVTPLNRDNQLLGLDNMTNSLLDGMDELCGHILNKLNEVISAINSINTVGGNIQRAQEATSRARQFKQSSMGNVGY